MNILKCTIFVFVFIELANAIVMYFKPDFKYGNSMKPFSEFEKCKEDTNTYFFVKYLINWVANCKVIFVSILVIIAFFGSLQLIRVAVLVTILSIALYFITLYPIIRHLDKNGRISPKGYSKTLSVLVGSFIMIFTIAFVLSF